MKWQRGYIQGIRMVEGQRRKDWVGREQLERKGTLCSADLWVKMHEEGIYTSRENRGKMERKKKRKIVPREYRNIAY